MKAEDLRAIQAPLKEHYRDEPEAARITLKAQGKVGEGVTCKVQTGRALVEAGLHPLTGGDGLSLCSGDMLLEALVACAGVTLSSVATALGIELRDATVRAEGMLDFSGTLAVSKETPVGFQRIRSLLRPGHRRERGAACHAHPPDRALLRRLPDATPAARDPRQREQER